MEPKCEVCSGRNMKELEDRWKCNDCDSERPLIQVGDVMFYGAIGPCEVVSEPDKEGYYMVRIPPTPPDDDVLKKKIQKMIEDHHDEYSELLYDYHGRIEKCHYQGDPIYDLADDIIKLVRK